MSNSEKTTTFTVSQETYNRLTIIKNHCGCTYSEVIEKLVEAELKNNYIRNIRDYEFITQNSESYFRILFKRDENLIEYLSNEGFVKNINKWIIPDKDKSLFRKFLANPNSMTLLENMGNAMEFDKFIILAY